MNKKISIAAVILGIGISVCSDAQQAGPQMQMQQQGGQQIREQVLSQKILQLTNESLTAQIQVGEMQQELQRYKSNAKCEELVNPKPKKEEEKKK